MVSDKLDNLYSMLSKSYRMPVEIPDFLWANGRFLPVQIIVSPATKLLIDVPSHYCEHIRQHYPLRSKPGHTSRGKRAQKVISMELSKCFVAHRFKWI
jgi:hypothetical protein